jgi:integration host factor subunit beta
MITKKDIVKKISEETQLTQVETKIVVQKTFDAIVSSLVEHGRIELRNFGVFEVKRREPRRARNPRTGKEVYVEAKHVVTFKPGKVMQDLVAGGDFSQVAIDSLRNNSVKSATDDDSDSLESND